LAQFALTKATHETWTDPEMRLLLSGGLDSGIVLGVASGKRKALTLELYSDETEVVKKVATMSGAEVEIVPVPDYEYLLRWSHLVTGAMHDSRCPGQLGLVEDWWKRVIPGVAHGCFHNTLYRGWAARKFERFPNTSSILFQWMGNAYYFDRYGCMPENLPQRLYDMLSVDGQQC
jgi:Asparagine synthase